ncbi:F-box protein [Raphanus sativus]|nr:F-box protein [Raphanus sativus]
MAPVKLSCDLEEEILSRLPPLSLVRSRNRMSSTLEHSFKRQEFPKQALVSVEVHEVPSDFPYQAIDLTHTTITSCDGFLFRHFWKLGVAFWNPWLRQVGWVEYVDKSFHFCGVGYDSNVPEKRYKILGYLNCFHNVSDTYQVSYKRVAVYECSSRALEFLDAPFKNWPTMDPMCLNGNLYWVTSDQDTHECFIRSFDFSSEMFKTFCLLPCQKNHSRDQLVLAVYKVDVFFIVEAMLCNSGD